MQSKLSADPLVGENKVRPKCFIHEIFADDENVKKKKYFVLDMYRNRSKSLRIYIMLLSYL